MQNFSCEQCGAGYSIHGYLIHDMEIKHGAKSKARGECKYCGSVLSDTRSLVCYMKSHLKCTARIDGVICGKEFMTTEETTEHKK